MVDFVPYHIFLNSFIKLNAYQFIISTVIQKPLCQHGFDENGQGRESPSPLRRYGARGGATREAAPGFG